jgi:hypothetical protein
VSVSTPRSKSVPPSEAIDRNRAIPPMKDGDRLTLDIWRVLEHAVDWFVLRDQGFEKLSPDEDGAVRSTIFPGLWLDVSALLRDDFGKVLDVLQSGIDSPEHAEFVADLRQAAGNKSRST